MIAKEPARNDADGTLAPRASRGRFEHRLNNILSLVVTLARQSILSAGDTMTGLEGFEGRVASLAAAHGELLRSDDDTADLASLAEAVFPSDGLSLPAVDLRGPTLRLPADSAQTLALVLHELWQGRQRTQGDGSGKAALCWSESGGWVEVDWEAPGCTGVAADPFGDRVIREMAPADLRGTVAVESSPQGTRVRLRFPLARDAGAGGGARQDAGGSPG